MHDKFEKEVQKKMEELRLTPSAPVWEKIELEIQPEKKRRRMFFWLFFGLLLAGSGFLTYQLTDKNGPVEQHASASSRNQVTETGQPKEKISKEQPADVVENTIDKPAITNTEEPTPTKTKNKITTYLDPLPETNGNVFQSKKRTDNKRVAQKLTQQNRLQKKITIDQSSDDPITTEQPSLPETKTDAVKPEERSAVIEKPTVADSSKTETQQKKESPKAVDSLLKRKVATKEGWRKQILASAGWSGYGSLFSSGTKSASNAIPQSTGSAAPIYFLPSETKGGLAFFVGFALRKKLNEHFEVAVGLQYAYYSTQTKVGRRGNDTTIQSVGNNFSAGRYYTNTGTNSRTNRFHVAEVPVTISYKPALKLPLYVSLGVSYGRLLSTNALTFSTRNNLYYEDKENYVRNMLPVSTSVLVELFSKKKVSLRVGPVVQCNLLKLQKDAAEGERHLFFAGLQSAINF